jgi:hypothetical protein
MKKFTYKIMFTVIMLAGLFIGIVRGQEAKQKWVAKKKSRYISKDITANNNNGSWVVLDEIEMATYHS